VLRSNETRLLLLQRAFESTFLMEYKHGGDEDARFVAAGASSITREPS